jgi:hypothetical protein
LKTRGGARYFFESSKKKGVTRIHSEDGCDENFELNVDERAVLAQWPTLVREIGRTAWQQEKGFELCTHEFDEWPKKDATS